MNRKYMENILPQYFIVEREVGPTHRQARDNNNNNNYSGRNGSCLTWLATSLEEKRRWLIMNASPRGQCSK